jgi:hypothetical protein
MIRRALLLLLLPCALRAQLGLFSFDGTSETPVGSIFDYGSVFSGSSQDVRFRARNTGNAPVYLSALAVSGAGFSISAVNGSVPGTVAPSNFLEFTVRFTAGSAATYSANLQVNSISTLLVGRSVPAPVITALTGCAPGANGGFDFGSVTIGSQHLCNFSVFNPNAQAIAISTLAVSGGFQLLQAPAVPLTLAANQATSFAVAIKPQCGTASFSGTLTINTQSIPLGGAAITPALPKPTLAFDTSTLSSGEQHAISMTLASPAVCAANGFLNLAFTPNTGAPITDDKAVAFLSGSVRALPFAASAGSTNVTVGGQTSAAFQTGTTAGKIVFSVTGTPLAGDPTTSFSIAAAPIAIDTATASNQRLGELDIQVIGYDNTYSAGSMRFAFFDTNGSAIGSAVNVDFTAQFQSFFAGSQNGSAFLMKVSFPVSGDQTKVGSVKVTLANSAGSTETGTLTFQ